MEVRKVYNSDLIRKYLDDFDKKDIPDQKKTLRNPVPLTAHEGGGSAKIIRLRSRPLAHERKRLIPGSVSFNIPDKRINVIYSELRRLDVDSYRNAIAVLFRAFLELTIDLYLDTRGIPYQPLEKLSSKAGKVVADMKKEGWLDRAKGKGIESAISSPHNPHSIDTFHAYVHNRRFQPTPDALNTAWDNLQPFFDSLFRNLK
jgi:hypothetical protein